MVVALFSNLLTLALAHYNWLLLLIATTVVIVTIIALVEGVFLVPGIKHEPFSFFTFLPP